MNRKGPSSNRVKALTLAIAVLALLFPFSLHSQWSTDPANNLIVGYGLLPEICSDSEGGTYVAYESNTIYPRQIALRRVNRYGYQPWGGSRTIQGVWPEARYAAVTADGYGGACISYLDRLQYPPPYFGLYNQRIRVQRIDSSGNLLWGAFGIRVSFGEYNQNPNRATSIVSDGEGGCIVAWVESLAVIRVNRINGAGVRMWGDSGLYVSRATEVPLMGSDGFGGCILVCGGSRLQRLDRDGNALWGPGGVQINDIGTMSISQDGMNGIVLAGMKYISYNNGDPLWAAMSQRVDSLGNIVWGENGIVLADSIQNSVANPPSIFVANNSDNGATFGWTQRVTAMRLKAFTQRLRPTGSVVFENGPQRVSSNDTASNYVFAMVPSLADSKLYLFGADTHGGIIGGQLLDSSGQRLWSEDIVLSTAQILQKAAPDCRGGIIAVGYIQADLSVRAQQASLNGNLGEVITGLRSDFVSSPATFKLFQNYPNPFNNSTNIRYRVTTSSEVLVEVYNTLGQLVETLDREFQLAGIHQLRFDAANLATGVYLISVRVAGQVKSEKVLYLK